VSGCREYGYEHFRSIFKVPDVFEQLDDCQLLKNSVSLVGKLRDKKKSHLEVKIIFILLFLPRFLRRQKAMALIITVAA
jgi:hypothetical protein